MGKRAKKIAYRASVVFLVAAYFAGCGWFGWRVTAGAADLAWRFGAIFFFGLLPGVIIAAAAYGLSLLIAWVFEP